MAGHGGGEGQAGVAPLLLPRLGEPEVQHLDLSVLGELDVRRLEVAVDDALLVRGLEGVGDLQGDGSRVVDRDRTAGDPRRQVLAFGELHDEERESTAVRRRGSRDPSTRRLALLGASVGMTFGQGRRGRPGLTVILSGGVAQRHRSRRIWVGGSINNATSPPRPA